MSELWYKNAVVYCLDVETFMDGDGDGIGDFTGLISRLDYLEALGITTIWLNPFYPSPNRDNGYDISDFYGVDVRLGNLGDFALFVRRARDRGIRVLVDLVVNHTSIDHPWFQAARADSASRHRDWYVWSKDKPADIAEGIIFPGVQDAVWSYDRAARAWYLHRFYAHQADLNIANPEVRAEILKIMGFWLELGVSGFRIDAVPFLVEYKGLEEEPDRDPLLLLSEMRDFLSWRRAEAIMLAEANVPRERAPSYFGGRVFDTDERMHMVFDFPLNQYLWFGLVRKDARPVAAALASRPEVMPVHAQWTTFLRNHDELSLDKLDDAERAETLDALAPQEGMRIYDRGARRRLAPMLGGDPRRLALAHALLFGLPGTPVMWYGDEIGMGENLDLPERWPVRTPMQWSDGPNAGFSTTEGDLVVALAVDGPGSAPATSVTAQDRQPGSLLSRVREMVRTRRACPEIGAGGWTVAKGLPDAVLGLTYRQGTQRTVVLANLSDAVAEIPLADLGDGPARVLLSDDMATPPYMEGESVPLAPYGYLWLRTSD